MSNNRLPIIYLERPVFEADDKHLRASRYTTDDGRFLVARWTGYNNSHSLDLIDLYRGERT